MSSMTGYASHESAADGFRWSWDIRSVNARGLDLRMRLPDGYGALEAALKKKLSAVLTRGSVNLSLRLSREPVSGAAALDAVALDTALTSIAEVEAAATAMGLRLAAVSPAEVLLMKGVADSAAAEAGPGHDLLVADADIVIGALVDMRRSEGAALHQILSEQVDRIQDLTERARVAADVRSEAQAARFRSNVAAILDAADGLDEARIAQEVATLAVKADVSEEIDRLNAHVGAARDLLQTSGPVGRKLDFLMQEFNREANTLCSKSGDTALTAIGLDLKLVIDQMREQVQNVE